MKAYLKLGEIDALETAATNLRDRLLVRVLSHSGCRISEALSLTNDNIDFAARTLTIKHLKTRLKLSCRNCRAQLGRRYTFCPGCGAKVANAIAKELEHRRQRIIPIDIDTLTMLKEYIDRSSTFECNGKGFIFGINRHRAWQIIKECARSAGLPKLVNPETGRIHNVSPHRLRDAFATHAVKINDTGDGLRMLQEYLGHASFNTTAKYRKVSGEEEQAWYRQLWEGDES